ncbi:MAG: dihydrolipoyl dehydrogenase [Acidobacteriota bacterium]|nr:dihydrolipoyl dehydrogenase [Acidobacteriota bacterium]
MAASKSEKADGHKHDLVVVGSGPGGYVAAIRAAQLGLDVACIEKVPELGGTCLRVGCIPSKALLEASHKYEEAKDGLKAFGVQVQGVELDLARMMKHKDKTVRALTTGVAGLFKKNDITRYQGHGRLDGPGKLVVEGDDGETTHLEAERILIATGSAVATLPGVEMDGDRIGDSTTALSYPEVPEHLVMIGAGVIGLELGSVWRRLGAKVTVLEYLDRILPGIDGETAKMAQRLFKKQGLEFHLGVKVTGARVEGDGCVVEAEGLDPVHCDRVLVAVGRKPYTENLGLDSVGLELDDRGRIPVNEHFATEVEGIFAIGDVIAGPMLAHKAEEEGVVCVEQMVRGSGHVNYDAIPNVVYTHPEIASVGKTEEQLQEAGIEYSKGKFPFMANGRAKALGDTNGQVKILADAHTDRILGVHIIGPSAGDLIAEAAVAIEFGASSEDLARSSHAHPTLAEVVKEAALAVDGRSINI